MTTALEARVARLRAHAEIRQLAAAYAEAFAALDLDVLVALFAPDVPVGAESGREALRRQLRSAMRAGGDGSAVRTAVLHVGTHLIEVGGGDEATGVVYSRGEMQRSDGTWFQQAICYRDRYVRREGRWLFWRRRHELYYGTEHGASPVGLAPANWPERDVGRGTLPEGWSTWGAFFERGGTG